MTRVVSWNCKVGRNTSTVVGNLQDLVRDLDPDVILLQEAKGYVSAIRDAFKKSWQIFADSDAGKDDPVMVREGISVSDWGTRKYTTHWVGPQGGDQKGRTWTYAVIDGTEYLSLHRCWGGTKDSNAKAYADEASLLVKAYGSSGRPFVVFGDTNTSPSASYPNSMKDIAKRTGGKLITPGGGIDYAVVRGVTGTMGSKKPYGSDHDAVLFVIK